MRVTRRQVGQRIDELVDRPHVRLGDALLLDQRRGGGGIGVDDALGGGDEVAVLSIAHPPETEHGERDQGHRGEARHAQAEGATHGGEIGGDPARLAEDHLRHEIVQEIALAGALEGRGAIALDAIAARVGSNMRLRKSLSGLRTALSWAGSPKSWARARRSGSS